MKFVKLPMAVEAVEVTTALEWFKADYDADGAANGLPALPSWLMTAFMSDQVILVGFDYMLIVTKAGKMRADKGDWIIQGVLGEIYPCPGDVFAQSYRTDGFNATGSGGFVIEHADGTRWRTLDSIGMPDWTDDRAEALCVTLRSHADAYAADDPEDVRIKEVQHGAPIWVANLQYFAALRAILFDESKEPRNRLQEIDNEICRIHPAVPAPQRPPGAARASLLEGPERTTEEIVTSQAEHLAALANACGLEVTIERRPIAGKPLAMRSFEPVIKVWQKW